MRDIVIVGAGGMAKEVAVLIADINRCARQPVWNLLGFVDASSARVGEMHGRHPILGDDSYVQTCSTPLHVAVAIGWPEKLARANAAWAGAPRVDRATLVHPTVVLDQDSVVLGRGVVICAATVLTADVTIGSGTLVNPQSSCGHDVRIGADCVLNFGVRVSGGVRIGDRCLLGSGAVILQNLEIGPDSVVGAGAVVTHDVPPGVIVAGVPARVVGSAGDSQGKADQ